MKPSKNRTPALPVPVRNLLDLHGLEARVYRQTEFTSRGTRTRPYWEIFKARPATPGAFGRPAKRLPQFVIAASATLDEWIETVGAWSRGERPAGKSPLLAMDFEITPWATETFASITDHYVKLGDEFARLSGLPLKTR